MGQGPMPDGPSLRAARKLLGMTQAELAQSLGMNRTTISDMERGVDPIETRTHLAVECLLLRRAVPSSRDGFDAVFPAPQREGVWVDQCGIDALRTAAVMILNSPVDPSESDDGN